jgi:hypothetical protein
MHLRRYFLPPFFFTAIFFGMAFAGKRYAKDAWKDNPILFIYF